MRPELSQPDIMPMGIITMTGTSIMTDINMKLMPKVIMVEKITPVPHVRQAGREAPPGAIVVTSVTSTEKRSNVNHALKESPEKTPGVPSAIWGLSIGK